MVKLVVDNGPARPAAPHPMHRFLLAQVHIARKAIGLDEEDYRALLERVTGHKSAKYCDAAQLRALVAEFERLGWIPEKRVKRLPTSGRPVMLKALAMWISLYQLGAIENGSDAALESFGRRQLKVDRLQWADERQADRLIEALKAIAERHGWSQRVPSRMATVDRIRLLKDRLVGAQLARLTEATGIEQIGPLAADRRDWTDKQLERAAAILSVRIRALPKLH